LTVTIGAFFGAAARFARNDGARFLEPLLFTRFACVSQPLTPIGGRRLTICQTETAVRSRKRCRKSVYWGNT
jgi:hypothetical protein